MKLITLKKKHTPPSPKCLGGLQFETYLKGDMNSTTNRNIIKAIQLRHTKEKLHEMKHKYNPHKKSLVKALKNLMKREERKNGH